MNLKARHLFFERLAATNPNPTTELNFRTHFELLIAVMLSAQTTDIRVNLETKHLFAVGNTPELILALGEEKLQSLIKRIGLYRTKASNIMKTCQILVDKYHGEVPNTREALESLPGVGRKTANVVLNTAFGLPTMAVDTHIFRVANRTGLAKGKTPLAVEQALLQRIPTQYLQNAHHWLILHGRYICTARKPRCQNCPVSDLCGFSEKAIF